VSGDDSLPPATEPAAGESETVGAPPRDDAPPRRQKAPFAWLAVMLVLALAVAALLVALGLGVVTG
jgi:hypothetical protein